MPTFRLVPDSQLACLLVTKDTSVIWPIADAPAILRHQLAAPLLLDLRVLPDANLVHLETLAQHACPPIQTFGDLIMHPKPPHDLLGAAAAFLALAATSREFPLPPTVVSVISCALKAAAQRHGYGNSRLHTSLPI